MDFMIGLPKSEGINVIMVVVDRLTMYAHFGALNHPFKTNRVSTSSMEKIQNLDENKKIIISDKNPTFTRNFWRIFLFCLCT